MASVRTSGAAIGDRVRRRLPAALVLGAGVLALAGCAQADRPQSTMDPKGDVRPEDLQPVVAGVPDRGRRRRHRVRHAHRDLRPLPGAAGPHGDAEAGARQPGPRDRSHGPPGRPAGGHRRADDQGPVRAQATPKDPLVVNVFGQQWWWEFDYPSIKDGDNLPLVTANEMVIPAGRQVQLSITSRDVIHSFWIPELNGKRDAVPGRVQQLEPRGRAARRVLGPVHRVLRPLPRQHAHAGRRADAGRLRPLGRASRPTPAAASTDAAKAGEAQFKSLCAQLPPGERAQGRQRRADRRPAADRRSTTGPRRTSPT